MWEIQTEIEAQFEWVVRKVVVPEQLILKALKKCLGWSLMSE